MNWVEIVFYVMDLVIVYVFVLFIGWDWECKECSVGICIFFFVVIVSCGFVLVVICVLGIDLIG